GGRMFPVKRAGRLAGAHGLQLQAQEVPFARFPGSSAPDWKGAGGAATSACGGRSFRTLANPFQVRNEKGERRRRNPVHLCGLTDGAGTRGIELLTNFS